jgi:hypothetical protein
MILKYHKNPSSGCRVVVPCRQAGGDRHDEVKSLLAILRTCLKIVKLKSVSRLPLSVSQNYCVFIQQIMLLFKNTIILVTNLFIYSSFSGPPKEKEYPECATSARTLDVSAVQPAYPFTQSVSTITIICVIGSINDHTLHKNSFEN